MRGGDAKHRRAAQERPIADQPWSAQALPARVRREAAYLLRWRKQRFRQRPLRRHSATSRMLTIPTARSPETTGM
jgi:hypothetical protein